MRHCRRYVIILAAAYLCAVHSALFANDIAVSSLSLTGMNSASDFILVKFNVSWENSWRTSIGPSNWDAAWVFVKFRVGDSNPILTGASSSTTTVTVSSTANLRAGMPVRVTSGTGAFAANTVISSITNSTQFVVSATPATQLSNASIECTRIWEHARLNDNGHTAPSGSSLDAGLLAPGTAFNATSNPALGVFLYRSSVGAGSNSFNNVQVRWNYGANGVADDAVISIRLFAVEMVYVPQGSFFVGDGYIVGADGTTENGGFTDGSWTSGATIPFKITSENALGIDNAAGKLWGISTGTQWGHVIGPADAAEVTLPAAFPKGFGAFYSMKYEVSQGQYREFLNTLTYTQQATRTINAPNTAPGTAAMENSSRNGLDIKTPGVSTTTPAVYASNLDGDGIYDETSDGEDIPMNTIDCRDLMAILDWAGLRPMTELEFEKAARGPMTPVRNEFAWGTASVTPATGISNSGETNEIASNAGANASFNNQVGVGGPLRVGAFAGSAATRAQAGASYYGIMELTGSQHEHVITVAMAEGRVFSGLHGNGALDATGNRDVTDWPETAIDGKYTGLYIGLGFGVRGGSYGSGSSDVQFGKISSRGAARNSDTHPEWTRSNRGGDKGGRGVRTAQ